MITRRNVTKGAAWAVPALTVAAAAPSLAASNTGHTVISACKYPGNSGPVKKGYRLVIAGEETTVTIGNASLFSVTEYPGGYEYVFKSNSNSGAEPVVTVNGKIIAVHFNPCN